MAHDRVDDSDVPPTPWVYLALIGLYDDYITIIIFLLGNNHDFMSSAELCSAQCRELLWQ